MKRKFIQIRMILIPLALMAGFLFAQENQNSDSTILADSASAVPRRTTHTVHYLTRDDLQHAAIRDLPGLLALQNGIIWQDGALHTRGGRAEQIAYFIDGANATNPFYNSPNFTFIPEAVQEIRLHTGAYSAELGGAISALVQTILRAGGEKLAATVDYRTDDFAKPGNQFFGTSPFGHRAGTVTLGGPAPFIHRLRFFLAGQHLYWRNRDAIFIEPFRFDSLKTDRLDSRFPAVLLPGAVGFERNYLPQNWQANNSAQGTLEYAANPFVARFTGLYTDAQKPLGHDWPNALSNLFWRKNPRDEERLRWANLNVEHKLGSALSYELALSFSRRTHRQFDPDFGDRWMQYPDSLANAKRSYTGYLSRYSPPQGYSIISGFRLQHENYPLISYAREQQSNYGAALKFSAKVNAYWTVKAGGHLETWKLRYYSVRNIPNVLAFLYDINGRFPRQFTSDFEREVGVIQRGAIDYYGYDYEGKQANHGRNAPHRPVLAAFYLQNHFIYGNFTANAGVRYERFDLKIPRPQNLQAPAYDPILNFIAEEKLARTQPDDYWLPRISLSFAASPRSEVFVAIGKYAQSTNWQDVYLSTRQLSNLVLPTTRSPYSNERAGFTAKPEQATLFEIGLHHRLNNFSAVAVIVVNKKYKNLLGLDYVLSDGSTNVGANYPLFPALTNNEQAEVRGVEIAAELHRMKRLAAKFNYTYSRALGTSADVKNELAGLLGISRGETYRLHFDQRHRGAMILDYRFAQNDGGKILSGAGLNVVLSFNSGHPYTHLQELSDLGQSNPWEIGVLPLIDPRTAQPAEPTNSSTTPWNFNVDLRLSKMFDCGSWSAALYFEALNFLNRKHKVNFYPTTGTTEDDGWLKSPFAQPWQAIPQYTAFYRAINLQNRWAYAKATGKDLFGAPRQIRLGLRLDL